MAATAQTDAITATLAAMRHAPLAEGAKALLNALGYISDRVSPLQNDDPRTFVSARRAPNSGTKSEREFLDATQKFSILFQVANDEIAAQIQPSMLGDAPSYDSGNARSFIFAAALLNPRDNGLPYSRSHYARFIREINKGLPPVVTLFQTQGEDEISIAFINRRQSKADSARDVLDSVSVIRGVSLAKPHRAHTDILAELALDDRRRWMDAHAKPQNFDGLLAAWLDALDTDALNNKFYQELFKWFQRAVDVAQFPRNSGLDRKEHVIRMLTRLIFIWFIKEKELVHSDLFIEERVKKLLNDYDRDSGDSYYRAVLQNLFFATLNTEIEKRRFSRKIRADHRNPGLYRYEDLMADPDEMLAMFKRTPFVNGGLFDCLDDFGGVKANGRRVDCFTDNPHQRKELSIPNSLFFGNDGLITLFDRYKFTVEENTPLEQEVALDPELLGNVFENLLAEYNRETWDADTARKQTGSYYTPRLVVDYMVDESLVAALSQKARYAGDRDALRNNLRRLLDYRTDDEAAYALFEDDEREAIVNAVANLKIIDPAVGSGAFPMGILHKLTLALRRVDPDNKLWRDEQVNIAVERTQKVYAGEDDAERREETQSRINDDFERHKDSNFGRKLYLIQNAIYGVDIQPVAAQIAKLRFFISLAIEQDASDDDADNYGIRELPNLETRFVAADTLIGLKPGGEFKLMDEKGVTREIDALNELRALHISTADRIAKRDIIAREKQAQERLAEELDKIYADWEAGQLEAIERMVAMMPNPKDQDIVRKEETAKYEDRKARFENGLADAKKIAAWKPLDQNAPAAEWFDAKYMFGVKDEFDVVIGNPPYAQLQKNNGELRRKYQDAGFATFASTGDIYQLFYEKGVNLLTPGAGLLAYITSNSWLKAEYGKNTRRMFAESHAPLRLIEMGKDVFQNAIVDSAILLARSGESAETAKAVDMDKLADKTFPPAAEHWGELRTSGEQAWSAMSSVERGVIDKIEAVGTPLKEWDDVYICKGVMTGYNTAFIIDGETRDALIADDPKSAEIIKPILRGRDIQKYKAQWADRYLIYARKGIEIADYPAIYRHLHSHQDRLSKRTGPNQWYELQGSPSDDMHSHFIREKLIWLDLTERGRFAYDDSGMFCLNTACIITSDAVKYLCAVLNSSLITWYMGNTALNSGMGVTRWIPVTVERIPVPRASEPARLRLAALVDAILAEGSSSSDGASSAATPALEAQVDELVLGLYGLSAGEGEAIERSLGLIHPTAAAEDAALLRAIDAASGEPAVGASELDALFREWDADAN